MEHSKYELGHHTIAVMIMCLSSPSLNCDLLESLIHIICLTQQGTLNLQNTEPPRRPQTFYLKEILLVICSSIIYNDKKLERNM